MLLSEGHLCTLTRRRQTFFGTVSAASGLQEIGKKRTGGVSLSSLVPPQNRLWRFSNCVWTRDKESLDWQLHHASLFTLGGKAPCPPVCLPRRPEKAILRLLALACFVRSMSPSKELSVKDSREIAKACLITRGMPCERAVQRSMTCHQRGRPAPPYFSMQWRANRW